MIKKCLTCGNDFEVEKFRENKAKFCSYKCYWGYSKTLICPQRLECSHCHILKDKRFFHKSNTGKYGKRSYCSDCAKIMKEKWKSEHYNQYCQSQKNHFEKVKKTPENLWKTLRHQAKSKGKSFNITFEQFLLFFEKSCYYCGDKVESAGLDRIDSSTGYSIENVVRACRKCNVAKGQMSIKEFLEHCKKIINYEITRGTEGNS